MSREADGLTRSNPSTLPLRALMAAALPQEFERLAYAVSLMRHFALCESHFDAAQRTAQHQLVEPSEMSDSKDFAAHFAEPLAKREIETIENNVAKRVGVVSIRHHDRRERSAAFGGIGAQDVKSPTAYCAPRRFGKARVPREYGVESLGE